MSKPVFGAEMKRQDEASKALIILHHIKAQGKSRFCSRVSHRIFVACFFHLERNVFFGEASVMLKCSCGNYRGHLLFMSLKTLGPESIWMSILIMSMTFHFIALLFMDDNRAREREELFLPTSNTSWLNAFVWMSD